MKLKRLFSGLLCAGLLGGMLAGCGSAAPGPAGSAEGRLRIVTTIFPLYDWTREVLGERADAVELVWLQDSGVDLHSYQPTAEDMLKLSSSDLFIYVGGESDDWAEDAIAEAVNPNQQTLDLLEALGSGAKEEERAEGMQDDGHGHDDEDGHEAESAGYDEHIWLSVKNAETLTAAIADALGRLDPDNAALYAANAAAYGERLAALDAAYRAAADSSPLHTLLFGDRFPFRYLTDDYGLDYYAAFPGCSAETEASFETIAFLAGKVDELGLHAVLTIDGSDHRVAETIVRNTAAKDARILTMDSMQAVNAKDAANGATYLSIMEANLEVLKAALS